MRHIWNRVQVLDFDLPDRRRVRALLGRDRHLGLLGAAAKRCAAF
jgi:hypothetical protein